MAQSWSAHRPIIGYKGGYPYNANDELVVQLNQPVSPGDAWVAGIRVGPLGGVYIIDVVPPTLGGFSNGFSNGFEVYDGPPIHIFSPADLFLNGEQGAWYDPSDLTTMFQDRAGTTPVTADGQTVGLILDKSGRGNHATAPSDAARPLYKTDGTYHWLQFDGVDDSLSTAEIDFTATDKMTIVHGCICSFRQWWGYLLSSPHMEQQYPAVFISGQRNDIWAIYLQVATDGSRLQRRF